MTKATKPEPAPQGRLYAHLDGIAEARRKTRVEALRREIDSAGRAATFGPGGGPLAPAHLEAIRDQVAQKRAQLASVEALEGDDLCEAFAADAIALARGEFLTAREATAIGMRAGLPAPPGMP